MRFRPLALSGILLATTGAGLAQDRLTAEISRLRTEAPNVLPEPDRAPMLARLDRAGRALDQKHLYLALYELQAPFEGIAGYGLSKLEKELPTQADFQHKWKELGVPVLGRQAAPVLFVEALAQAAEGRAVATYHASLPYAEDSQLSAGLYYLGESHAMTRFAALCRGLDAGPKKTWPQFGSIDPQFSAYEREVVKAYDAAPASLRPRFPGIHVAIKIARTLNDEKKYPGALLQYLISRYRFNVARTLDVMVPAADVARRLAEYRLPQDADHSIAEFFLQFAATTNAAGDSGPAAASAILDDILPAYFAVVKK